MKYKLEAGFGPKEPICQVETPPFRPSLTEPLRTVLEAHGCRLEVSPEKYFVRFPEGTLREELWPRVLSMRYRIVLPDGYTLSQTVTRQGQSYLGFPLADIPKELRKQCESA